MLQRWFSGSGKRKIACVVASFEIFFSDECYDTVWIGRLLMLFYSLYLEKIKLREEQELIWPFKLFKNSFLFFLSFVTSVEHCWVETRLEIIY